MVKMYKHGNQGHIADLYFDIYMNILLFEILYNVTITCNFLFINKSGSRGRALPEVAHFLRDDCSIYYETLLKPAKSQVWFNYSSQLTYDGK